MAVIVLVVGVASGQIEDRKTSSWNTFQSEWHPFIIDYPASGHVTPHLHARDYQKGIYTLGNERNEILIYDRTPETTIYISLMKRLQDEGASEEIDLKEVVDSQVEYYMSALGDFQKVESTVEHVSINGWEGYVFKGFPPARVATKDFLFIQHEGRFYEIKFNADNQLDWQIINTLRFVPNWEIATEPNIKPEISDTSFWQTFQNATLPYRISYPQQSYVDLITYDGEYNVDIGINIYIGKPVASPDARIVIDAEPAKDTTETSLMEFVRNEAILLGAQAKIESVVGANWRGYQFKNQNNTQTSLFITHEGILYRLTYAENDQIHAKVIESFKFTNPEF